MLKDREKEEGRLNSNKIRKTESEFCLSQVSPLGALTKGHLGHNGPPGAKDRLIFNSIMTFNISWLFSQLTFVRYYLITITVKIFSKGLH